VIGEPGGAPFRRGDLALMAAIGEPARELSRDALETVTQTVNRMKSLLRRLREAPHGGSPIGGRT
jgi:hypothetical protein